LLLYLFIYFFFKLRASLNPSNKLCANLLYDAQIQIMIDSPMPIDIKCKIWLPVGT